MTASVSASDGSAADTAGYSFKGTGSWRRRLASFALMTRALFAVRTATPYSQLPTDPDSARVPALRASTRNTAWKASSASGPFPTTRRHTPYTIGPCRRSSSANAPSSRVRTYWPTSSPSDRVSGVDRPRIRRESAMVMHGSRSCGHYLLPGDGVSDVRIPGNRPIVTDECLGRHLPRPDDRGVQEKATLDMRSSVSDGGGRSIGNPRQNYL